MIFFFFFSSRRRHTRFSRDWSSDVCSSDLHVQSDRKLDARVALALMSIQSVKGVEVGDGFATAGRVGSEAHDEIVVGGAGLSRTSTRAGGIEGGMSTGQPIRV